MKIKVSYEVSEIRRRDSFSLEDLGLSENEWKEMNDDEKNQLLMEQVEHVAPYWAVYSFEEVE